MKLIQSITVPAGGLASVTFSAIPNTFTNLEILLSARITESNAIGEAVYITINGSTSNFTNRYFQGPGSTPAQVGNLTRYAASQPALLSTNLTFGNGSIRLPSYTNSLPKSISTDSVSENNATTAYQAFTSNLWNVSSPITEITLVAGTSDLFTEHSRFDLYGILAGSDGVTTVS